MAGVCPAEALVARLEVVAVVGWLGLGRPQHGRRKVRMVGGVRVVLRLETEGVRLSVRPSVTADSRAVEEVGGVDLYTWTVRPELDGPAGARVLDQSGAAHR